MILIGDVRQKLKELPDKSVHCCVTSPPYFGLRDYGEDGQIGLEDTPEQFVANMVEVFREVWRVLRDDGTLWLNLGDSYSGSVALTTNTKALKGKQGTSRGTHGNIPSRDWSGLKPKDLVGIPWRVAFALQADGWYLRQDIIWHKPNPMPESVTDRCTKSHEYIFLLSKSRQYYFDNEAIKEPSSDLGKTKNRFGGNKYGDSDDPKHATKSGNEYIDSGKRNKRDVWSVPVKPFKDAHFATFPTTLIEPCILAGTSAHGVCATCAKPYERIMIKGETPKRKTRDKTLGAYPDRKTTSRLNSVDMVAIPKVQAGWEKICSCESSQPVPAIVLDPFFGAGTTGLVAQQHGRNWIGCELNPVYAEMATKRIKDAEPQPKLFT